MPERALYMKGFLIIKNIILSKQTLLLVYILVWGMQAYGSANLSSVFHIIIDIKILRIYISL